MKRTLPLVFFALLVQALCAQYDIKLPGVVVEQNSKYKTGTVHYLEKVSIQSIPTATAISGPDGHFELIYSDYRGGQNVKVFARKYEYEVVNQKELDNAAVLGRYEPLKIVMCKEGTLAENQVKYYQIGVEAIQESYLRKIALLEGEGKEKDELVQSLRERHKVLLTEKASILFYLEKDKNEALSQVKPFSERFAEVNLDDADSLYVKAYEAYLEKRIDDVFKILDLQLLEQNMEKAKAEIARGKALVAYADSIKAYNLSMLEKFAKSGWLAAHAATKNKALEQAQNYYVQSLKASPCNFDTWYSYIQFQAEYMPDKFNCSGTVEQAVNCLEKSEKNHKTRQMVELLLQYIEAGHCANTIKPQIIEKLNRLH